MIELAVAASAAATISSAVTTIDKVYNWWMEYNKGKPAGTELRDNPQKKALQYEYARPDKAPRVVMTYEVLAKRLTPEDVEYIDSFEKRMKLAGAQWLELNKRLPLADAVERARIEANMLEMKDRDICPSLIEIVTFIELLGVDLEDHYNTTRQMCRARA